METRTSKAVWCKSEADASYKENVGGGAPPKKTSWRQSNNTHGNYLQKLALDARDGAVQGTIGSGSGRIKPHTRHLPSLTDSEVKRKVEPSTEDMMCGV